MSDIVRVGMVGISEGNGHPYSFSSIINGYSDEGYRKSSWEGIYNYLRIRDRSEFGVQNLQVTHAWTQDSEQTKILCEAALIQNSVPHYEDLIGKIDAVIIARDDYENHKKMAQPFLEAGLPVFIDKPLSLSIDEIRYFKPYMQQGKLMSCSGLRYAKELDTIRGNLSEYGKIKLIRGMVLFSWEKYGIHMLEAIISMIKAKPVSVYTLNTNNRSVIIALSDDSLLQIDALGNVPKIFRIDVVGEKRITSHEISDNFSMFRRMLWHFAEMIRTGRSPIPVEQTLDIIKVLIAGNISYTEKRAVTFNKFMKHEEHK